ncbi:deoxyhypusine synthase family protein [Candidatus Pacearchaeota archaeon]|nr:deoxyhypusine synthase family protein [Candidatus Pacearchaeota archaeon]
MFNKSKIKFLPLSERESKTSINAIIDPNANYKLSEFNEDDSMAIEKLANEIKKAKQNNQQVILACGAHLIKNGLSLVIQELIEKKYITHLATNGATLIHDWEFAYQGKTEEDVRKYLTEGQFGLWEETGRYQNLAIIAGAGKNKGYGESLAEMVATDKIIIPERDKLSETARKKLDELSIKMPSEILINHPHKKYSVLNAAYKSHFNLTIHPHFGHDIIYTHPLNDGASLGKAAEIDFLKYVDSISHLQGGIYLSIGSAIMSPQIFEKALSMARNVANQEERKIDDFMIVVNDVQEGKWDFKEGKEPSKNNPAYYLRFNKTFARAGARDMQYFQADNRDFLLALYNFLK